MTLQNYSRLIEATKRGSTVLPPARRKEIAYSGVGPLKDHPELYPVLDVGCGLGYFVQACMENGIPCTGVDLDNRQLKRAKIRMGKYGLTPNLRPADAKSLPFNDGSFGYIYSVGMLMMIPFVIKVTEDRVLTQEETREEVMKVLSEMKRVVRDNGQIRIITFSDKNPSEPEYYKPKAEEFKQLGVSVGLRPVQVNYYGNERSLDALFKK